MPTTSDILAGKSEDVAGGNTISQSDTATLAKTLLGEDAVNQFGDVIGARPATIKDVMRDFAIGFKEGPGKVAEIKALQAKAYNDAVFKQQQQALARKKADLEQVRTVLGAYKSVFAMPAGARAGLLKSVLEEAGISPNAAALKLMLDADTMSQLPPGVIDDALQNDQISTSDLQQIFGSPKGAMDFVSTMSRANKDRKQLDSIALDLIRKRQQNEQRSRQITEETTGIQQNFSPKNVGDPKTARAAELAAREKGIASADQPFNPQFKGVKTDKIRAVMKREALPPKKQAKAKSSGGVAGLLDAGLGLARGGGSGTSGANLKVNSITKVE